MCSHWCWVITKTLWVGEGLGPGGSTVTLSSKILWLSPAPRPWQGGLPLSASICCGIGGEVCAQWHVWSAPQEPFHKYIQHFMKGILACSIPFLGRTAFSKVTSWNNIMSKNQRFLHFPQILKVCLWGQGCLMTGICWRHSCLHSPLLHSKRPTYKTALI